MSKKLFYGYFFIGLITYLNYYFWGLPWVQSFLGTFILYFFIIYGLYWVVLSLIKKDALPLHHFFAVYSYKISLILSCILLIGGTFTYYHNNINPAKLPLYTLSNGTKEVRFQGMSHIAQKDFYTWVQTNIARAKNEGFVLYYEGVKPGRAQSEKIFSKALWVQITPDLYEQFSKIYGVTHQDNNDFLGIRNDKDVNIDLNIDEIVSLYLKKISPEKKKEYLDVSASTQNLLQNKYKTNTSSSSKETLSSTDITKTLLQRLSHMDETQLQIIQYVNKSLLNFIIKQEKIRTFIITHLGIDDIFTVILDDRNKYIATEIIESSDVRIFAMYGVMHFDGILEELQKHDENWKIIDVEYSYPITYKNYIFQDTFSW